MAINLRDKKQRARYRRYVTRRRDSHFAPSEKIVRNIFGQMATPVTAAFKDGGKSAALKAVDNQTNKVKDIIQRIWGMAGGDAYQYAAETFFGDKTFSETPKYIGDIQYKAAWPWLAHVAGYVSEHTGDKIKWILDDQKDQLKDAIFAGEEQGEGVPKITQRVQEVFTDMEPWRAKRIAQSEVIESFNQATIQQGIDRGSRLDRIWITADDDKVRPAHAAMDLDNGGHSIPFDQDEGWDDCDDGTHWPGDAVNCRCTIGYAVPEAGDETEGEEPAAEETTGEFPTNDEFTPYLDESLAWARENELPWKDAGISIEQLELELKDKPFDNMPQDVWEDQLRADVKESLTTLQQMKENGIDIPDFTFDVGGTESRGAKAFYSYSDHQLHLGVNMGGPALDDRVFNFLDGGDYTPSVSEQTIRGTVYHEMSHAMSDLERYSDNYTGTPSQISVIENLSDADKELISKLSKYAEAAANQKEISGFVPQSDEAFAESVGVFADGNNPLRKFVPNSVKDKIVAMFGSTITKLV